MTRLAWRCDRCGTLHAHYAPAERCADSHGGGVIRCEWVEDPPPETQPAA